MLAAVGVIPELPGPSGTQGWMGLMELHIHCVEYWDPGVVDS